MPVIHIHISLKFIVPFISAGIALLSVLIGFHTALKTGSDGQWLGIPALLFPTMIMAFFGGFTGLLILRFTMKPMENFIKETLPLINSEAGPQKNEAEMAHYQRVFKQVGSALSRVDARTLFPDIVGESRAMREVLEALRKVAATDTTVLITGESGTGKERIAEGLHKKSRRVEAPLVRINCMAIPDGLLESELFGHEKGAFTGADRMRKGKFELATSGTLFLDEIGDMPMALQGKLLRVLQEKQISRVGGDKDIPVDVRIVAATHQNLEKAVAEGRFREDLFYRLNVFRLTLPPLRERREDIPFFCQDFSKKTGTSISSEAIARLMTTDWPGNVRELLNTLERAAVFSEGEVILTEHLENAGILPPQRDKQMALVLAEAGTSPEDQSFHLDAFLKSVEKRMLVDALKASNGVQARAAEKLGINQRSMWHRVKKYGLEAQRPQSP